MFFFTSVLEHTTISAIFSHSIISLLYWINSKLSFCSINRPNPLNKVLKISEGKIKHTDVKALLDKLPITTIFHEWNIDHNPAIFSQCDCGFIPLSKKNLLAWHKPANKLISFWFSGLPTIVSDTPAYVELMNGANSKLYCSDTDDWVSKIKWIRDLSAPERKQIAARNLDFVQKNYCNEALNTTWQQIFERLNFLV